MNSWYMSSANRKLVLRQAWQQCLLIPECNDPHPVEHAAFPRPRFGLHTERFCKLRQVIVCPADYHCLSSISWIVENLLGQPRVFRGGEWHQDRQFQMLSQRFKGFLRTPTVAMRRRARCEQGQRRPVCGQRRCTREELDERKGTFLASCRKMNVGFIGRLLCVP